MSIVVAIDGAAGAGKTTLARGLAEALELPYVNTGVMYRALARRALDRDVSPDDAHTLVDLAQGLRFGLGTATRPRGIEVEGAPPGPELKGAAVEAVVSRVARHPEVRRILVERQRALGANGGVVEGRDIGTVVFPDAEVKIFLTADPRRRAARRADERPGGADEEIARNLRRRDERDARTNPFEPAPDAIVIDATDLTIEQVRASALATIRERTGRDAS